MFTFEQFNTLHSIWDGKASNVSEVCGKCGICCDQIVKTLIPGEYEYLESITGQKNTYWAGSGCLCAETNAKPVICKVFPISVMVDYSGWCILPDRMDGYSTMCRKLDFAQEWPKIKEFLSYLFSDADNRLHWIMNHCMGEVLIPWAKTVYQKHGRNFGNHANLEVELIRLTMNVPSGEDISMLRGSYTPVAAHVEKNGYGEKFLSPRKS